MGKPLPDNEPVQINEHAVAIVCGMGEENARIATQILIEKNVSALISWGTAGALTDNIHSGDLILADKIISTNGESYDFDTKWNKCVANKLINTSLKIHHGSIAHAKQVLTTSADKSSLQSSTLALAVDMESYPIIQFANTMNLPCLAVRAIIDEASHCIPEIIIKNTDSFGRPAVFALFSELLRKPNNIANLIHLGKGMKSAKNTLTTIAKHQALF